MWWSGYQVASGGGVKWQSLLRSIGSVGVKLGAEVRGGTVVVVVDCVLKMQDIKGLVMDEYAFFARRMTVGDERIPG